MDDFAILSAIIGVSFAGAIVTMFVPARRPEIAKAVGYATTMITFGLALWLLWNFNPHSADFQFVQNERWIPALGVRYIVGVDGISIFMIVVTALLFPLGLLASERYIEHRVKAYIAWFLLLEGAIMGIFLSLDLILFFVFWELMLVPMYFLIQGWGSAEREYAAMKFFLYTAFGSAFLLASTLALGFIHQADTGHLTFNFQVLANWNGLSGTTEVLLFLGFMAAFAIKAPLFPFHTWLPLVHTEAPTAGSVVLAGVILKMGAYGLLRFSFELFPQASVDLAPILLVLAVIGIIYGAIVAAMQTDLKRVIAYSSVAHMGFVVLGIFSLTVIGIDGAVFTMLSHPLTTGALFLVVGMLYERRHTREISEFRGIWKVAPILGGFFLIALFAGIGLPGFSGFIGEFLSLLGTFVYDKPYAIVATFGVILAAVYSLWAFQRTFTGKPQGENAKVRDVSLREVIVVAPLLALSLFLGLYPKPALDRIQPSVQRAVHDLERKSDYREPKPPGIAKDLVEGSNGQKDEKKWIAAAPIQTPHVDWLAIAPEISLAGAAVLIVLLRAMIRRRPGATLAALVVSGLGVLAAGGTLAWQWIHVRDDGPITTMAGMVRVDGFGVFLGIIVVIATALALLVSVAYLRREGLEGPEYLALMLFSAVGMIVMTAANDLIVVFLALEVLSIPLYVLAAFDRRRLSSQEAGIKYFVLGAFSSAIFLYGVALVYGATGTTSLPGIADFLANNTLFETGTLLAGFALLLVGLGFKVAAVPFHTWTPDVYQGAPTPVTSFMASATKTAGFAALLRVFLVAFPLYKPDWQPAVWVLTVLTLLVGSIGAALQTDVKRLLAYSSIAHAGYVLIGFEAATVRGIEASLFYLFVYTFMVVGSFAIVTVLSLRGDDDHSIDGYRGLAFRHPVLGGLFIFFLLAQAGIPLTGGFIAKLEVFSAATEAGEYALVAIGAVATVIAAYAYLRVALAIARPDEADEEAAEHSPLASRRIDVLTGVVLAATAAMTLVLGVLPSTFVDWARHAGGML